MNVVRLLPVFLNALLIAAHFLRVGSLNIVWISLIFPLLLLFPERWAARIVQFGLIIASLIWVSVLFTLVQQRIAVGLPSIRLATIIGTVAIFTGSSACVFFWKPLKVRYKLDKREDTMVAS